MIELPLIFLGGLLGSAHCIGMCGPLAIALSSGSPSASILMRRQVLFSFGRLFTYGFCGAVAGFGGAWLTERSGGFVFSQAWLAIAAGVALVLMGLVTTGLLPTPSSKWLHGLPCGSFNWLKTFLTSETFSGPLIAGMFTGFIPCGLVYAFLLRAGSTGGIWSGWLTMVVFGAGTIPLMLAIGYGGQLLSQTGRARLFRVAAWCIVLTGAISIVRGGTQLHTTSIASAAPCPLCEAE